MADQEAYDVVAHYDPVAGEILEPLDKLTVREITCFKINLDEIVDADADIANGVTFDGDLFMADESTIQLATVQGVGGAEIDFLDDIAFDTGSGVKFGLGTKLDEYQVTSFTVTFSGAITGTDTWKYIKIGDTVTLSFPTKTGATTAGQFISVSGIPANIRIDSGNDFTCLVSVHDNGTKVVGALGIDSVGGALIGVDAAAQTTFSGPGVSGIAGGHITYNVGAF